MKKGFSLVEVLAVITLLGIIVLLALPAFLNKLNNSKVEIDEILKNNIYAATDLYIGYNKNKYNDNSVHYIKVEKLVNEELLDKSILNGNISLCVKIIHESNKYNYEIVANCVEG